MPAKTEGAGAAGGKAAAGHGVEEAAAPVGFRVKVWIFGEPSMVGELRKRRAWQRWLARWWWRIEGR